VTEILVASLVAKDEKTSNDDVRKYGDGRKPPNERISNEVNLTMILNPAVTKPTVSNSKHVSSVKRMGMKRKTNAQVDPSSKRRPRMRARVVGVSIGQTGVRLPHDALELEELGEESRSTVVDLLRVGGNCERRSATRPGATK
jgi:hypothetical protein